MRWDPNHKSKDVIDRRGDGPARGGFGGGGGNLILQLLPMLLRSRLGLGGTVVVVGLLYFGSMFLGSADPQSRVQNKPGAVAPGAADDAADRHARFTGFVLDDVQGFWTAEFARQGKTYERARLVLFTGSTNTACGLGESAAGPFYCPADHLAYIDLAFYADLERQLNAGGDFAQAYVIAHEIGHHVQNLLGTSERVRRQGDRAGVESGSVRLELQADCFAGLWARSTGQRQLVESGDLEEALRAAASIGDDTLQKNAGGRVRPESFTHGTSAQRGFWFRRGFESGDVAACDTFSAASL